MLFDVHALTPADFDAWLQGRSTRRTRRPPPAAVRRAAGLRRAAAPASPRPPVAEPVRPSAGRRTSRSTRRPSSAPADTPFKIDFDNQDPAIPHNVEIHEGSADRTRASSRARSSRGPPRGPTTSRRCQAGTYAFICTVHPNMTGTLTVELRSVPWRPPRCTPPPRLPQRPVRVADDDRSQEDRDPVHRQLVPVLLPRRHARAGRPHRARRSRASSS